jgi:hypothetical protein
MVIAIKCVFLNFVLQLDACNVFIKFPLLVQWQLLLFHFLTTHTTLLLCKYSLFPLSSFLFPLLSPPTLFFSLFFSNISSIILPMPLSIITVPSSILLLPCFVTQIMCTGEHGIISDEHKLKQYQNSEKCKYFSPIGKRGGVYS